MNKNLRLKNYTVIFILMGITLVSLIPFFWMISTSLKDSGAIMSIPIEWIPKEVSFDSYVKIFTKIPFLKSLGNSILITLFSTVITILSSSMAAFVFAKFDFKFKKLLFTLYLASMMIPIQVTGIPIFIILTKLGLTNTYLGVIMPSVFNVFAIFLLRQYMTNIPDAYIEAAILDGANFVQVYRKVVMPMSTIPLTTLFVINFMNYWNDYFWPLIVLTNPDKMTLPVILSKMNSQYATEYNTLMAGALVSLVPILIVYAFSQKYFIQGLQEGGIK
ncbi:carbohydrate ABC transporter permease [Acidaminobacter sp. JC074]|uniref:carbohydrate ABC transporter permease n=1 Tax=Acidaminobacter sp. JC074 TaxID=2530199 RepID=UPI001F0EAC94|nr:carbohydrate ABC transporter permease [Acidaminobacter sp. JC074]MCH4891331.1 carbohydrate ABC transporter permease [Acidaminobacter sp. JC074]